MNFVLQTPSLQHLAGVKIVACLWNQRDILSLIAQAFNRSAGYYVIREKWRKIEIELERKFSVLELTEPCRKQAIHFIEPLGTEIIDWRHYHNAKSSTFQILENLFPQTFCWTMHGTVDYAKTAESMVKDERLSIETRYELACINCLEPDIRELFDGISEVARRSYVNMEIDYCIIDCFFLIVYFTCDLSGCLNHFISRIPQCLLHGYVSSINRFLFKVTLPIGTRATCEYWFEKLNEKEKKEVLDENQKCAFGYRQSPTCNLMYFLLRMDETQHERMLRAYVGDVLRCLLRWPTQSLFMETAKRGLQFLNMYNYEQVLQAIIYKVSCGCKDYDYCQLFWECWTLCPADYKADFLDNDSHLKSLFGTKKEEFIKLILNEAPWHVICDIGDDRLREVSKILMNDSAISDAALVECKEKAMLVNLNEPQNADQELRSRHLSRLVGIVIKRRIKRRSSRWPSSFALPSFAQSAISHIFKNFQT